MPEAPSPRAPSYGPWLVAAGAALWGTESAWRIPLIELFSADVIVFYEHVILVLLFLPVVLSRGSRLAMRRAPVKSYGYLLFSGIAGSAVGTVLFTEALHRGNPTVVNVILNIQPVLSTAAAYLLFHDRLAPRFFLFASLAIACGVALCLDFGDTFGGHAAFTLEKALKSGTGLAFLCALFWGLSTVAGRGVMVSLPLPLASGLRVGVGLCSMAVILLARGNFAAASLFPPAAQAHPGRAVLYLILLSTLSGGLPLLLYFEGLKLTRASTAGYFEMMQTLAGVIVTWGWFHHPLLPHQVVAGILLIIAVALVQKAQSQVEGPLPIDDGRSRKEEGPWAATG